MPSSETVPRHELESAKRTIIKMQKQLDDIKVESRRDIEEATGALQNQLRVVQNQQRMTEDQLHRSMQRERDLRGQVSNADVTSMIGRLRADLEAKVQENLQLRDEMGKAADIQKENEALKQGIANMKVNMETHEESRDSALRKAEMEIAKLRKALENADVQLVQTIEAKDQEFQEAVQEKDSILRTQQAELQELHDALTESHNILAATDQVSNQYSGRVRSLEMDLKHSWSQLQESRRHSENLERQIRALEDQIAALEADLSAEQDLSSRLSISVTSYEAQLVAVKDESASSHDGLAKQCHALKSEVEDLQVKLAEVQRELKNSQTDLKDAKEIFRNQLGDAESETKELRDLIRAERDLLDRTMREHNAAVSDQLETQKRIEHSAMRREEALQRRLQQAEEDAENLRTASVPEAQIKRFRESALAEKEELETSLQRAKEELKQAERALALSRDEVQHQTLRAQHGMTLATQQIQPLELQLQEALAEGAKERRLRVSLAEQVQYLTGATEGLQSSADAKLSKVAEMVLRSLSEEHRRCVLDLSMTAVEDSRGSSLNASQGPQQRTALGIVLRDTTIEAVVPGSPADLCGKVFPRDELIMVDGSTVSAVSAMGALRGDDSEGGVVSIVVRSATSGGPVQVKLFREGIAKVREQQAQEEELKQLEEQAQQAMALGEWPVVEDRVRRLAEARRITQQMHLEALCRVGEWAQALKQSLQHTIIKGRQAVLSVDACHQRVHVLQEAVEKELREDLGRGAADTGVGPVDELHLTIQQLERAAKLQQQEVKGLQALLQDAEEREAREVEARKKAEAQARAVREVENEMQKKMAVLEAQSGDVLEELGQFPAVVALRLGGLKFAKGREREALTAVEQQLQAEVSVALQVPSSSVQILCSYGEEEVVALLKLSSAEPSHSAAAQRWPGRSGRVLAEEMMAQVEDGGSVLRNSGLGKAVKGAQMHGPISELTARSMKHALAARDREWHWVEQELTAARGRVEAEVSSKSRDIGAMAVEVDARVAAARAAGREDGRQEMSLELNQKMQEQADALQTQWKSEAQEGKTREAELSSTVDALEESCRQKDSHVRALQGLLTDLQGRLEVVEGEVHAAEENQRQADQARVRSAELALQMRQLVGPEVHACLTTLNNVESELGFFHAYQTRAVSIAGSLGGLDDASGATSLADAAQSKGMIDKDIGALREQLENLLELIARHCSSSADALRTSTRGRVPHPVSEKEGTGSFSSIWKAGMAVEAAGLKGRGGLEGRSWPQQDSVFTHEEKTVEAKPGMSSLLGLQKANGESAELEKSSLIRDTPPQKALPDVPMGDVAGRFVTGTSTSNYSATSSPTREVRLSPVKTGSSHISDQNSSHGVGRAWSIGSSGIPRVLTSVARGKQSFGMKVAVLEARQMPETMDENYLCGCLSLLPQSINDHYDRLEQHLLVPQHRTLPACGTGRVLWEGRRELNFSRSRILYYKHADDDFISGGPFSSGPTHVDYGPQDVRRNRVEVIATEELTGQAVLLLLTLHTAGTDSGSRGTIARCVVPIHRGMDAENWYPLEGPRGAALENDQGQPSMLRLRIEYLPGQEHAGTHGESKQDWLSSNAESSSNSTTQAAAEPTFPPSGEAPSAPSDGEKDAATEGDGSITRSREHSEEDTKSGHVM